MKMDLPKAVHLEEKFHQMQPLIIIGMHRSGTSLTVRLLKDLGIHMGRQLSRDAEAVYFQKINRRIYRAAGSRWGNIDTLLSSMEDAQFCHTQIRDVLKTLFHNHNQLRYYRDISDNFEEDIWQSLLDGEPIHWGWKDPRTSLTFPIWLSIFPQARFLNVVRNGIDVAISIHRRTFKQKRKLWKQIFAVDYCPETLDFGYCFKLWEKHLAFVLAKQHLIPTGNFLEIRYEDLLARPHHNLHAIAQFFGYPVQEERLDAACQQVNKTRLVNTAFARPYREKIAELIKSPWLAHYNYSYQVDWDG